MTRTIRLLLLVVCCYVSAQVYSQKTTFQWSDSIMAQVPSFRKQADEWKQKTEKNPTDEEAWFRYDHTLSMLRTFTPGKAIEKEISDMLEAIKKHIPNTATYALIRNSTLPFREQDMSFKDIIDKWPDAVLHYPTYLAVSLEDKERLERISTRWYQSGTYPPEALTFTYNELISADKDALIITDTNFDLYGSYLLRYGKGLFADKKVIFSTFLIGTPFMDKITEELGIPKYEEKDSEKIYMTKTPVTTLMNKSKECLDHIIKYTKRPVYFSISVSEPMKALFKPYLHPEGLLMRYSPEPYDNLAVMRRNFENTYLLDYLRESFYPEKMMEGTSLDPERVEMLSLYYVPAFRSLLQFYKESGDVTHYDKLYSLLESVIRKAKYCSAEVRERYLKSIDL